MPVDQGRGATNLISHPWNDYKHGSEDLNVHSILQYHKDSMARFENFITAMKNIKSRIENGVNKNLEDTIKQTRKFLSLVCHALVYIDGQVLSLRFHKGD